METKQENQFNFDDLIVNCAMPFTEDLEVLNSSSRLLDSADDLKDLSLAPTYSEETLDIEIKYPAEQQVMFPISRLGPPERTNFSGDLNFEIAINGRDTHKKKYVYSDLMNRIYVVMGCDFPLQFTWSWDQAPRPMFVRATVVFSDESQAQKRVERCLRHLYDPLNAGLEPVITHNVLRSSRPPGTAGIYYCGEPEKSDSWYSVLVEFPAPPEVDTMCSHVYKFVCTNSCTCGINRRGTDIIFTLEDAKGNVYGRHTVGVRVCACPRRDVKKDEEAERATGRSGKRPVPRQPSSNPSNPPGKRIRTEPRVTSLPADEDIIVIPQGVQIVGTMVLAAGFQTMLVMMERAASLKKDPQGVELYTKPIADLRLLLEKLQK